MSSPPAAPPTDRALGAVVLAAGLLDDIERSRIASEHRATALRDVYGLAGGPEEALLRAVATGLLDAERQAEKALRRAMRAHPLGPWARATIGVGDKQLGRLLAVVGDPYWHPVHDRPRRVSELWAYCGLHVIGTDGHSRCDTLDWNAAGADDVQGDARHERNDTRRRPAGVAPARRRGEVANWSAEGRTRAYLIAVSCVRQRTSPYRTVYEQGREKYAEAVHPLSCPRCGPARKPAQPGSPLNPGHAHARALRLVMKALLRDMWAESRRLRHDGTEVG